MPNPRVTLTAELLVTADYYLERGQPTRGWEMKAACGALDPSELPQEATSGPRSLMLANRLRENHCSGCVVRLDCARKPLGDRVGPAGAVHGGHTPAETAGLWKASRAILRAGSLAAAAAKAELDIAGVVPAIPFEQPADAVAPVPAPAPESPTPAPPAAT